MALLDADSPAKARYLRVARPLPVTCHTDTRIPRPAFETLVVATPTPIALAYAAHWFDRDVVLVAPEGPLAVALSRLVEGGDPRALETFWPPFQAGKSYESLTWAPSTVAHLRRSFDPVEGGAILWSVFTGDVTDLPPDTPATWLVDLEDDPNPLAWVDARADWLAQMVEGDLLILARTPMEGSKPLSRVAGADPVYHLLTLECRP